MVESRSATALGWRVVEHVGQEEGIIKRGEKMYAE